LLYVMVCRKFIWQKFIVRLIEKSKKKCIYLHILYIYIYIISRRYKMGGFK